MSNIYTVSGAIAPERLGTTLVHEHVMVDFGGAPITGPHRWNRSEVATTMLPYLQAVVRQGVSTLVECTPAYLGRDPGLLRTLSTAAGLQIVTNTGFYKEPYLPEWVFDIEPARLAERWVREFIDGIDETGIRPGLIKIAVNPGILVPVQEIIVRAAAITHMDTGLAVMAHTGDLQAAQESLDLIEAQGMNPNKYIVAHADQIGADVSPADQEWPRVLDMHQALLERGVWLEYDSIGWSPVERHVALLVEMLDRGLEKQVLISQDAGWYHVGEPGGGQVRPMTALVDDFLPALRAAGVNSRTMEMLLIENPARVLAAP